MRPPSSSKPRSPTTDAIQLQDRRTRRRRSCRARRPRQGWRAGSGTVAPAGGGRRVCHGAPPCPPRRPCDNGSDSGPGGEHVVVFHEMFHQRRIIPLDGRPRTSRSGRSGTATRTCAPPTSRLHMVDRFTHVDATRPWGPCASRCRGNQSERRRGGGEVWSSLATRGNYVIGNGTSPPLDTPSRR